jgi:hypothetical protein
MSSMASKPHISISPPDHQTSMTSKPHINISPPDHQKKQSIPSTPYLYSSCIHVSL